MRSGPSTTCSGPSTPRRARNSVFIAPSADCAEARPFHCDRGLARTTAKDASLTAAIAMACTICRSVNPIRRPAAALCEKASCVVWSKPAQKCSHQEEGETLGLFQSNGRWHGELLPVSRIYTKRMLRSMVRITESMRPDSTCLAILNV